MQTHEVQTKYVCQSDDCAHVSTSKKNHLKHTKKCKHLNSPTLTNSKPSFIDNEVSGKDSESEIKSEGEKSQKILCKISGCAFISHGRDEAKMEEHFQNNRKGKELTKNSFILLNSVMADAIEILQEIRKVKAETR